MQQSPTFHSPRKKTLIDPSRTNKLSRLKESVFEGLQQLIDVLATN